MKVIYLLEKSDKISLTSSTSQKDLMELIRYSTGNRIFTDRDYGDNLMQCSTLINNVRIRRLESSHSFEELPKLIKLIEKDISHLN